MGAFLTHKQCDNQNDFLKKHSLIERKNRHLVSQF